MSDEATAFSALREWRSPVIVPSRRMLVARTLLGVVIAAMALLIIIPPGFERSFTWTPRIIGCAGLLGGLISYALRPTSQS